MSLVSAFCVCVCVCGSVLCVCVCVCVAGSLFCLTPVKYCERAKDEAGIGLGS